MYGKDSSSPPLLRYSPFSLFSSLTALLRRVTASLKRRRLKTKRTTQSSLQFRRLIKCHMCVLSSSFLIFLISSSFLSSSFFPSLSSFLFLPPSLSFSSFSSSLHHSPVAFYCKVIVSEHQLSGCIAVHLTVLPVPALVHSSKKIIHCCIEVPHTAMHCTPGREGGMMNEV